jgi:RecB family endonuclease NucS
MIVSNHIRALLEDAEGGIGPDSIESITWGVATSGRCDTDAVDLLAKGKSGEHIAIELKIVEARRGDYAQLVSYMGNLESSGVPADKARGILIAPAFGQKVLNSAATEPRVTLLRFDKGA